MVSRPQMMFILKYCNVHFLFVSALGQLNTTALLIAPSFWAEFNLLSFIH